MVVGVAQDQIPVGAVAQHDVVEQRQAELGKLDRPASHLLDFSPLLLGDPVGHPAGDTGARVHLAPADHLDDSVAVLAHLDHLAADLQPDLVDHAQDVALPHRRVRSHDEVRPAQCIEVGGVVGAVERAVEQLPQQLGRPRRIDVIHGVGGLGRGHVVRLGAHAADAVGDDRHLLHRPADRKLLEAAQLRDLEIRVADLPLVVEEDLDLAMSFEAGDWIDGDALHVSHSLRFPACAPDEASWPPG